MSTPGFPHHSLNPPLTLFFEPELSWLKLSTISLYGLILVFCYHISLMKAIYLSLMLASHSFCSLPSSHHKCLSVASRKYLGDGINSDRSGDRKSEKNDFAELWLGCLKE